jgi:hypothetical protein
MPTPFQDYIYSELPLRPSLWKGADANGDPNSSSNPAVQGSPLGTLYLQDDVSPKATWQKQGTGATDWVIISGSFQVTTQRRFAVTTAFAADEPIDLDTGDGDTAGLSSVSGDNITELPAGWETNHAVKIFLNGVMIDKIAQVTYATGKIAFNQPLDPSDIVIVASEETI